MGLPSHPSEPAPQAALTPETPGAPKCFRVALSLDIGEATDRWLLHIRTWTVNDIGSFWLKKVRLCGTWRQHGEGKQKTYGGLRVTDELAPSPSVCASTWRQKETVTGWSPYNDSSAFSSDWLTLMRHLWSIWLTVTACVVHVHVTLTDWPLSTSALNKLLVEIPVTTWELAVLQLFHQFEMFSVKNTKAAGGVSMNVLAKKSFFTLALMDRLKYYLC